MEKFHKDKNKIKELKIMKGIPLFISFCYNQRIRSQLKESKLFIEKDELHYHLKFNSDYAGNSDSPSIHDKESEQYVVKSVSNYSIDNNHIVIEGIIEKTKNGLNNNKKIVNKISLYRIYQDEEKLLKYLKDKKNI